MLNTPFQAWPSFTQQEADAVQKVLLSNQVNYWTGTEARTFEKDFAQWVGTQHAIALANGTVALDIAFKALNIAAGDEVIVTPRTFLASVSSIINAGAVPIFAEVDRDSQNITAESIAAALSPRTRAIVCVHLAGWPCDMDPIMELAAQHNLKVIEDCAQAHGARYKGRSVGSIGHVGCWSFCQDKIMSTGGEGGMVTTNDDALWRTMWAYKDHGKSYAAVYEKEHPPGFRWLHDSFGTNWRMTEMQAAIGRIQLRRMPEWTRLRTANANSIAQVLEPYTKIHGIIRLPRFSCSNEDCLTPSQCQPYTCQCVHAHYKFYCFVRPEYLAPDWSRDRIIDAINAKGVPCFSGTCSEVYLEKAFDNTSFRPDRRLPVAKELGDTSLMFLVHPTLTTDEINKMIYVIQLILNFASKPRISQQAIK